MIPFKQKSNSILKNTAVIIILLCLSDSCFSFLQDFRRTAEDYRRRLDHDYRRQVFPKDESHRSTVLQRELVEVSPYIRDVRADSRQSRIDARDIRTDFREIRTELRNLRNSQREETRHRREQETVRNQRDSIVADNREDVSHGERMFQDINNNIKKREPSRIVRDNTRDRRDTRNIRDDSGQYQNYSRKRSQRQLPIRETRHSQIESRKFDSIEQNERLLREPVQEDSVIRRQRNLEQRQIRNGRIDRLPEERREGLDDRRTLSRNNERRFERLSYTSGKYSHHQEPFDVERTILEDRRQGREDVRRFRDVEERSNEKITALRFGNLLYNGQDRQDARDVRYFRDGQERSNDQSSNSHDNDHRVESRALRSREHSQQRFDNIKERQNARQIGSYQNTRHQEDQKTTEITSLRQDIALGSSRGARDRVSTRGIRNNNQLSRISRFVRYRFEDFRQGLENTREWPRTLRESRRFLNNRQLIQERQRVLRESIMEERKAREERFRRIEEISSRVTGSRTEDFEITRLLVEHRKKSRTHQQARRETERVRKDVRNSLRNLQEREDSERRQPSIGKRRDLNQDSRGAEINDIRDGDIRRNIRDSQTRVPKMVALRNVDFIPDLKEKSNIFTNTLQAVIIVALFGQIFISTSKNKIKFLGGLNFIGKEKIL